MAIIVEATVALIFTICIMGIWWGLIGDVTLRQGVGVYCIFFMIAAIVEAAEGEK